MKNITKELLSIADLLKELKTRGMSERMPELFLFGWKAFDERCEKLNEEIKKFKEENKNVDI